MSAAAMAATGLTGMANAVLTEIAARAAASCVTGTADAVDLTSIPLTAQDRASLEARLGRGEVVATIEAAGRSEVWETAYAGVWFVRHFGEEGRVAVETIEIADAPSILLSHLADRRAASARLAREIADGGDSR